MRTSVIIVHLILFICDVICKIGDPYTILGLTRKASSQDIKKAYKKLAKEWHPDKNPSTEAEAKFIEINQAYELLMDPERRRIFDQTGQTEDQPNFRKQHDYSSFRRFDPFDDIFSNFGKGFKFNFKEGDEMNIYRKQSITFKAYENSIIKLSRMQPYIILFYSDWCIACAHIEPIWRRLVEELEPINFGMATVHAGRETELARKIGVKTVPYVIMLLDGHPYHYTEPALSMVSTLEFIRSKFPMNMVQRVNKDSIDDFLSGWLDNKVRVMIFGRLDIIRLRYLTVAWEFRERAAVCYVQLDKPDTDAIRVKYGVSSKVDTLLVFHEDPHTAVASVAMTELPYATMKDIIEGNKFLILPRLSSQAVFDSLCPVESMRARRRLCVVLVTEDNPAHEPSRQALRDFATGVGARERVRYTYIFREKQIEFINALTEGSESLSDTVFHIVILWRKDTNHLKYEWLAGGWDLDPEKYNGTREALRSTINRLLHSNEPMPYETIVQELFDEHAQGIFWKIINKVAFAQEYISQRVHQEDVLPAMSVLVTILFIIAGGYIMSYLVKLEEESINGKNSQTGKDGEKAGNSINTVQLRIHELRGETYNGLVRLLKPGCRTIVLLCDGESKSKLVPKLYKACWPYRKNKTLMFAFLNIDRPSAMEWYKRILVLGLTEPRDLSINPKNTIGTVIALNGHRKYYCLFHAKHPEGLMKYGNGQTVTEPEGLRKRPAKSGVSGDFMGFSDVESDTESDVEAGDTKKESVVTNYTWQLPNCCLLSSLLHIRNF
ncbi:dnaJ homolog subfamily C member 16 l(3)80Fg isoform X2 [Oratosquilla oratoria]|uniref:dnaJ homolog subfamily C member 16 l(3)80Fg isoform X2 n=1 Tax=Oratosquilla oratoria TaxID=337810 RepID=UPI003F765C02